MTGGVHIGSGAGFAGDRFDAAGPVVETLSNLQGSRYLIFEVLAERTLAIAQRLKQEDSDKGYSPWLTVYLHEVLKRCYDANIKIVANFGSANPRAAAIEVHKLASTLGISDLRVVVVEGDDLLENYSPEELLAVPCIEGTSTDGRVLLAANAYLGARTISDALGLGADIVLVGRTTDAALVLGPLIHEFEWSSTQYDLLAAGTLAGHLLECGAQLSGGYFADPDIKDVPRLHEVGFPIATVTQMGDIELFKATASGGLLNRSTVIEQLLYEVHDPARYLTPDVILDFTGVEIEEIAPDRVRIFGARGQAPTETLKVTLSVDGGWLGEAEISYAGSNALARAKLACDILEKRQLILDIQERCRIEILGTTAVHDSDSGALQELRQFDSNTEYRVRVAIRSDSKDVALRMTNEVLALYCCGPAGGGGVRQNISQQVSTASILLDRERIEAHTRVHLVHPSKVET